MAWSNCTLQHETQPCRTTAPHLVQAGPPLLSLPEVQAVSAQLSLLSTHSWALAWVRAMCCMSPCFVLKYFRVTSLMYSCFWEA